MGKFPLLTWYLLDTHTQKKINCTYIYKFVFLYLQLLNSLLKQKIDWSHYLWNIVIGYYLLCSHYLIGAIYTIGLRLEKHSPVILYKL